jgi:xanthine/uracil permease
MLTMPAVAFLSLIVAGVVLWLINGYIPIPSGRLKTVLNVVLGLIIVGIGLWLINTYIPMAGVIKALLNIVVVTATCVGVLQAFGLWAPVVNMGRKVRNHRWSDPDETPNTSARREPAPTVTLK